MSQSPRTADKKSKKPDELPLIVTGNSPDTNSEPDINLSKGQQLKNHLQKIPRLVMLPLLFLILFTGAVIGIYFQPPGLKLFMKVTGLEPGGGSNTPIAVAPPKPDAPVKPVPKMIRAVVALGKLIPDGDVVTVAMPYGAGDARIEEIRTKIGRRVTRGETLAVLDNTGQLKSAVQTAQANVALKKAALKQTRSSISASLKEARATAARAKAAEAVAQNNLIRKQKLFKRGVTSQSSLDDARLQADEAKQDVAKAEATLSRYESKDLDDQPDIQVAARNLDAARADLNRARQDQARGTVNAPVTGTVLDIHVRPGEKPGNSGIVDIGNTDRMTAEIQVYQSEIARVEVGQAVELTSDALSSPLTGLVSSIGYSVGRQTQLSSDPAANTDARVIKVIVQLDNASSAKAARLTFLEVVARISVKEAE